MKKTRRYQTLEKASDSLKFATTGEIRSKPKHTIFYNSNWAAIHYARAYKLGGFWRVKIKPR